MISLQRDESMIRRRENYTLRSQARSATAIKRLRLASTSFFICSKVIKRGYFISQYWQLMITEMYGKYYIKMTRIESTQRRFKVNLSIIHTITQSYTSPFRGRRRCICQGSCNSLVCRTWRLDLWERCNAWTRSQLHKSNRDWIHLSKSITHWIQKIDKFHIERKNV
jgi:hypothetical protein